MTVYAPTDSRAITIPVERGGCGQPHEAGDLAEGARFVVDCPRCEPHIIGARLGWAHTPHGVALTPDEIASVEQDEARAKREQNRTWGSPDALAHTFAAAMAKQVSGGGGSAPSLLEQIAALTGEERAALAAMLTASTETVIPAESGPGEESPKDDDLKVESGEPEVAKRRPGRPRKILEG
jgi:hypothetical protein